MVSIITKLCVMTEIAGQGVSFVGEGKRAVATVEPEGHIE